MGKIIDITGQRFGRLTVLERAGSNRWGQSLWRCVCVCENETVVAGYDLRSGRIQSCGCLHHELLSARLFDDITGQRFGRWIVIERAGSAKDGSVVWKCVCDCGNEKIVLAQSLRGGDSKSCGCYMRERASEMNLGKIVSEETRRKLSEAMRGKLAGENHPMYGKTHSPESIEKMRVAHTGKKVSPETRRRISEAQIKLGLVGEKSPNYGRKHTPEELKRLSEAFSGEKNPRFGKPPAYPERKRYTLIDGSEVLLRSTYEQRVLNVLIAQGVPYEYESCTYEMGNCTYHPDIYLPALGIWMQPKGYPTLKAVGKMLKFNTTFPNDPERILFEKDIDAMEKAVCDMPINFTTVGHEIREGLINHAFAYEGHNEDEHWRAINRLFLVALTPKSICAMV